jgi:hypothetical protein
VKNIACNFNLADLPARAAASNQSRHTGAERVCGRPVLLSLMLTASMLLEACGSDSANNPANTPVSGTGGGDAISTGAGAGGVQSNGGSSLTGVAGKAAAGAGGQPIAGAPTGGGQPVAGATKGGAGGIGGASVPPTGGAGAGGRGGSGGKAGASVAGSGSVALTDKQTLIPHASWTCNMPDGIVPPKSGQLVFEADMKVGEIYDLGETQYGHRHQIDITGGTVTGAKIKGEFLTGGLDYQLTLSNGALEIEQINIIRTSDGAMIYFRNCGTSPGGGGEVRTVPDFEATEGGAYAWLNTGKFVGIRQLDMAKKTLKVSFYDVSGVAIGSDKVRVIEPDGVVDQSWECKKKTGTQGAVVYTENVTLGTLDAQVGASKYGTRNIIPITGGTTTGKISGEVLPGGADYQLLSTTFEIDARYTLKTDEGELIIVRNCGPIGGLVPVFETRKDGKYGWIDKGNYLSSDPGLGNGGVALTLYEAN